VSIAGGPADVAAYPR